MVLDAFVFESDRPKARAVVSVRVGTDSEVEDLLKEIRKQGNAKDFPILLKQILTEAAKVGGKVTEDQFEKLSEELELLKAKGPEIRKFKRDMKELLDVAERLNRPIVF